MLKRCLFGSGEQGAEFILPEHRPGVGGMAARIRRFGYHYEFTRTQHLHVAFGKPEVRRVDEIIGAVDPGDRHGDAGQLRRGIIVARRIELIDAIIGIGTGLQPLRHQRRGGGISRGDRQLPDGSVQRAGIGPIRDAIKQIRAARPDVEILLMTGAFGAADPRSDEELAAASHSTTSPEGRALRSFAAEERCGFLDMTTPWSEYIRSSGLHPHRFYRDRVHANEHGEQILARILLAFFAGA